MKSVQESVHLPLLCSVCFRFSILGLRAFASEVETRIRVGVGTVGRYVTTGVARRERPSAPKAQNTDSQESETAPGRFLVEFIQNLSLCAPLLQFRCQGVVSAIRLRRAAKIKKITNAVAH